MFLIIIIILLIFVVLSYKISHNVEKSLNNMVKKENFSNYNSYERINNHQQDMKLKNECKEKEENYNKLLTTPVAVNVPYPEYNNIFFIGENYYKDKKIEPNKNSFPVYNYKYDGVFKGNKMNNNHFQIINWNGEKELIHQIPYNKNLVRIPEKELPPNAEIIKLHKFDNNNNINNYNGTLFNINTQKDYNCNGTYSPFSDIYIV